MKLKKVICAVAAFTLLSINYLPSVSFAQEQNYVCPMINAGHSGSASGTGLFLGAVGTTEGTCDRAPFISGVTGNNSAEVASARIGALEFSVDGSIDPETITYATLNVYVSSVNENLKSDWMLLAAYETNNPSLTYNVGGMDQNLYPAKDNNYSYEAAFWSNEECSKSNLGWKTIDIKRAIVNALEENNSIADSVNIVLRLQVPAAGLNISTDNEPFIEVSTNERVEGIIRFVDQNGNDILPERPFASGAGKYSYMDVIDKELDIDGTLYLYDSEKSVTTIDLTQGGQNEIILVYNNTAEMESFSGNTLIESGATCWFADPRSVTFKHDDIYDESGKLVLPESSKTIVGAIDTDGTVKAVQCDNLTEELTNIIIDTGFEADDHNNPTFLYLPDHRIMVFWSKHTTEEYWYYRVTEKPDDLTTLGEEKKISVAGYGNYTYPSPFYMSDAPDSFFVCWRGVSWHPTIAKYSLPDENGDIVCEINPTQLVQSIGDRPYVKYGSNGKDKIYFTFTTGHPDNEYPNWVYYAELDINTLNLYNVEGDLLCEGSQLPYGKDSNINTSSDYGNFTIDSPTNKRDWVWDVAKDENGLPVVLFTRISNDKSQHDYYYAKWNPETQTWDKTFIADGGGWFHQNGDGKEKCYSGGMCLDHSDPSIVYVSKPTEGLYGSVYEIWKLVMDNGSVESETQITFNSKYNNVRPFVAWGSSSDDLISLTWMNGLYYYWVTSSSLPDAFPTSIMTLSELPEIDNGYGIDKLSIPKVITSDYMLPKTTIDGTAITWSSSDDAIIDSNGYVTMTDVEQTVTLTATNEYGSKEFTVTVPARDVFNNNMILGYEFEPNQVYSKDGIRYIIDVSGNENDAAVYGNCEINGALDLSQNSSDKNNNSYAVAPDGILSDLRSYTVSLKVNAENLNTSPRFYDFGYNSGNSFFLRGNTFSAGVKYKNGTTALLSPDQTLDPGTEYFLTVTFDAKTKNTKIYVNSVLAAEGTNLITEPYLLGENGRNYIGRTQWWDSTESTNNADFCGTLDDFYMFNTALTEDEIKSLYSYEPQKYSADITANDDIITVDITKDAAAKRSATIVASYNSEGVLIGIEAADNDQVTINRSGVSTVKVLCFNSLENLNPVHDAIVKSLD